MNINTSFLIMVACGFVFLGVGLAIIRHFGNGKVRRFHNDKGIIPCPEHFISDIHQCERCDFFVKKKKGFILCSYCGCREKK